MPKKQKYKPRTQQCFCKECKGGSLPWSTWARHHKALAEQTAILGREAGLDADPTPPQSEDDHRPTLLERNFLQTKSKKAQRAAHIRARLLTIRDDLHRLRGNCQQLSGHVTFLRSPKAGDAKAEPELTTLGAYIYIRNVSQETLLITGCAQRLTPPR